MAFGYSQEQLQPEQSLKFRVEPEQVGCPVVGRSNLHRRPSPARGEHATAGQLCHCPHRHHVQMHRVPEERRLGRRCRTRDSRRPLSVDRTL